MHEVYGIIFSFLFSLLFLVLTKGSLFLLVFFKLLAFSYIVFFICVYPFIKCLDIFYEKHPENESFPKVKEFIKILLCEEYMNEKRYEIKTKWYFKSLIIIAILSLPALTYSWAEYDTMMRNIAASIKVSK
jgi:hypothetical protein